ncbi:MAG: hypothetical protein HOH58_04885 [Opitutaceae bacterium]|jgi:sugar phosphate isomerase/epimerase|nr:hypothetical protein [Opitutaceae bacterium]
MNFLPSTLRKLPSVIVSFLICASALRAEIPDNFKTENLLAWCIAHRWDSEKRNPDARADLLHELDLNRFVYNWTKKDNPQFEAEIIAAQKHGLDYYAFWNEDEDAFALFEKYGMTPQIWKTCPSPEADTEAKRIAITVKRMAPFAQRAQKLGSKFGLYNHRGWGGHPEILVKVCLELRELGYDNVGIVYNFHHSHQEMQKFAEYLAHMQPYLLCINLNGMADKEAVDYQTKDNMILPIGTGNHEATMIKTIIASGYAGPIGILGHTEEPDVALSLRNNIAGLAKILESL